jgi:diaminopimelate epimerase
MSDADARKLLESAAAGAARCMAHGHRFGAVSTREPVVVEKPGGTLEVMCRECAEHYGASIVLSRGEGRE